MGREETVHNKINRRRRSQIWHQWYDGRASTTVKNASYKAVELPNLAIVTKMTVLGSNKCVLKTQRFFFLGFLGLIISRVTCISLIASQGSICTTYSL